MSIDETKDSAVPMWGVTQLVELTGLTRRQVYDLVARGVFRNIQVARIYRFIPRDAVAAWDALKAGD